MCLLTYLPAGTRPDLAALHRGADLNPDGHGYAIVTGRQLIVGKDLDADTAIANFDRIRRTHPDGPALFHSRLRTHGHLDLDNCHPFEVDSDPRTVIAHNGILPATVWPRRGDHRSDTRIAAEDYLPSLGRLHLRRTRLQLEKWMGPTNLMVMLTVDRHYRQNAYLFNEASGIWDHGTWYSNDAYLPVRHRRRSRYGEPGHPAALLVSDDVPERQRDVGVLMCAGCGEPAESDETWCPWCSHCWACAELPSRCDCWAPATLSTAWSDRFR